MDFLNGDPDQPIIMGRTYHQENRSPGSLPGTKTQMTIRSKTYKGSGFNELMFEDKTNNELLSIHAQRDMKTEVLHDRTTDVANDHTEKVGGEQTVTVNKNQTITVTLDQTTTVKQDRIKHITGNETVIIGNNQNITVTGKYILDVKTDSCVIMRGGANIELKDKSILFKVGSASILMTSDGGVYIEGALIKINGREIVDIDGGQVQIN